MHPLELEKNGNGWVRLLLRVRTAMEAGAWCGLGWRRKKEIWPHKNAQSGLQVFTHGLIWD
jgi:hypothetical protein